MTRSSSLIDATLDAVSGALPRWLPGQRWFAGKARTIQSATASETCYLHDSGSDETVSILCVTVHDSEDRRDQYLLPIVVMPDDRLSDETSRRSDSVIATFIAPGSNQPMAVVDASRRESFWRVVFQCAAQGLLIQGTDWALQGSAIQAVGNSDARHEPAGGISVRIVGTEQSNTSAIIDERWMMKLFRRLQPGVNPELEIGRFLAGVQGRQNIPHAADSTADCHRAAADSSRSVNVPALIASVEAQADRGAPMTVAVVQELVPNQGDAWSWTLAELARYLDQVRRTCGRSLPSADLTPQLPLVQLAKCEVPPLVRELTGGFLELVRLLGRRTAELHKALACDPEQDAFRPEALSSQYRLALHSSMSNLSHESLTLLRSRLSALADRDRANADWLLAHADQLAERFQTIAERDFPEAVRMRTHGDYHLGQVLFTGCDFVILDFEGEPDRTINERRIKMSPVKDAAGMLRSFHYASHAVRLLGPKVSTGAEDGRENAGEGEFLEQWLQVWYAWTAAAWLHSYLATIGPANLVPSDESQLQALLDVYLLEKAIYELRYEVNNRPGWMAIPLEGILQLLGRR